MGKNNEQHLEPEAQDDGLGLDPDEEFRHEIALNVAMLKDMCRKLDTAESDAERADISAEMRAVMEARAKMFAAQTKMMSEADALAEIWAEMLPVMKATEPRD